MSSLVFLRACSVFASVWKIITRLDLKIIMFMIIRNPFSYFSMFIIREGSYMDGDAKTKNYGISSLFRVSTQH